MLPQKGGSNVDVLRVRRAHWVLCQVLRPLVILENRNARRTKPRDNKSTLTARTSPSYWCLPDSNDIVQYGGADSNRHNNQLAKSNHSTALFLTNMHNMGDTCASRKHGVSPRDQTTFNARVRGAILKSRILKLDHMRLCAGRGLFNLRRFCCGGMT